MGFFLLETLKTTIKMRNLTSWFNPRWTQSGHFFPKLGHFFPIFEKGQGHPSPLPPSSYAPDVGLFIILKQVYISCCLIIMSTTTSHRLKQNNFPYRNLNHRNFLPGLERSSKLQTFSSPDLNCSLCQIFRKVLRNIKK